MHRHTQSEISNLSRFMIHKYKGDVSNKIPLISGNLRLLRSQINYSQSGKTLKLYLLHILKTIFL